MVSTAACLRLLPLTGFGNRSPADVEVVRDWNDSMTGLLSSSAAS